jgi:hypothetical protein
MKLLVKLSYMDNAFHAISSGMWNVPIVRELWPYEIEGSPCVGLKPQMVKEVKVP